MPHNTVLLVDDEPRITQGLLRALADEPYQILCAASADEALAQLRTTDIQVVITDERMPHMTGAQLVVEVRRLYPHIMCMILSGEQDFAATVRALNDGDIYRFLSKPCPPVELATSIRLALEQQALIAQSRKLLDVYKKELAYQQALRRQYPDIFHVIRSEQGDIVIEDATGDCQQLLSDIDQALQSATDRTGR